MLEDTLGVEKQTWLFISVAPTNTRGQFCLLSPHCVPGSVQDACQALAYFIPQGRCCYSPPPLFTDEETEAQGHQGPLPRTLCKKIQSQADSQAWDTNLSLCGGKRGDRTVAEHKSWVSSPAIGLLHNLLSYSKGVNSVHAPPPKRKQAKETPSGRGAAPPRPGRQPSPRRTDSMSPL